MGHLVMNTQEQHRASLFEMVKQKHLTLVQVASQMGLSYRQTKRLYRRYREAGAVGLIHRRRGTESNRKHPQREAIIRRYQERYEGFGSTLAAEKLSENDNLPVHHDTLRKWLLSEQLWHKQRKRSVHRQRRESRAQFGELLQIDGSFHDWFENEQLPCLINMVDDATSKTLSRMEAGETTRGVFLLLQEWIRKYGIPLALYVDRKTVYVSPKKTGFSHVQRACQKLGIRIIEAHSPQAKGRVERNHAVYQDRFVKELRLRGIKTLDEANAVLSGGFIDNLNEKFEKKAREPQSAHRPFTEEMLTQALCWEYERQVQHDWTFSFKNKHYQIDKPYGSTVKVKSRICVRQHLDGSMSVWHKGQPLTCHAVTARFPALPAPVKAKVIPLVHILGKGRDWHQSNHSLFTPKSHAH